MTTDLEANEAGPEGHTVLKQPQAGPSASSKRIPANNSIPSFLQRAAHSVRSAESHRLLNDTRISRVLRKYSLKDVCEFLNIDRKYLNILLEHPDSPEGEVRGRECLLSVHDIMRLRALNMSRPKRRVDTLFWRKPGSMLPVIVSGSQKGGSAKTLTAANLSQFLHLFYGLRVGIIDADPQASISLYFSDSNIDVGAIDQETFINFMGISEPGSPVELHHAQMLDKFWRRTPWPGLRLIPGGPSIQEGDISLFFASQENNKPEIPAFHSLLQSAIKRHGDAFPPVTLPEDLTDENGRLKEDVYERALNETLDVIIIDCAPSLSLAMLNTITAATSLVVPTSLKGFDLSTLQVYLNSASDMMSVITADSNHVYPRIPSLILPTIVSMQTDTDLRVLKGLMDHDPEIICPVFYSRSEAVANAAEHYQSLYEYVPSKGRKRSTDNFLRNANAVNDALASRFLPDLPTRGYANAFLEDMYGGALPKWTEDV